VQDNHEEGASGKEVGGVKGVAEGHPENQHRQKFQTSIFAIVCE
jgi:hypothetical protein